MYFTIAKFHQHQITNESMVVLNFSISITVNHVDLRSRGRRCKYNTASRKQVPHDWSKKYSKPQIQHAALPPKHNPLAITSVSTLPTIMSQARLLDEAVKPPQHTSPQQFAAVAASAHETPQTLSESKRPSAKKETLHSRASSTSSTSSQRSLTTQQTSLAADRRKAEALKSLYAPTDPISQLPSSPPQIYLNLLILEASLRSQYLTLRARRRQHIFFLLLLSVYLAALAYACFLRPREDGQGYGGSPYWLVDAGQKVGLLGGIITVSLIWGTGVWERGVRWPRRWVGVTNRGLRVCNLKVVVVKGTWYRRLLSALATLFPVRALFGGESRSGSLFAVVDAVPEKERKEKQKAIDGGEAGYAYREGYRKPGFREEDIAPGGDAIKLLLLPKHFSPEFRENWDMYRQEYWQKENERRKELRKVVRAKQQAQSREARKARGWFEWTGLTKRNQVPTITRGHSDIEKMGHGANGHLSKPSKDSLSRRRRASNLSVTSHSRSSSRSSMGTTPETDDGQFTDRPKGTRKARPSATSASLSMSTTTTRPSSRRHEIHVKEEEDEKNEHDLTHTASEEIMRNDAQRQYLSHSTSHSISTSTSASQSASKSIKAEAEAEAEDASSNSNIKAEVDPSADPQGLHAQAPALRTLTKRASSLSNASSSDDGIDDAGSFTSERSTTSA